MDQGPAGAVPQGAVGPPAAAVAGAVVAPPVGRPRAPGAAEADPAGVRARPQAAPRPLLRRQGRVGRRAAGDPLLHGPLGVRLQGMCLGWLAPAVFGPGIGSDSIGRV